ncbi:MAG: hypothetical protein J6Q39_06125 [Bacteroidales bacterium]|nr:hypothetical protein [Bacteroidales bacterium]
MIGINSQLKKSLDEFNKQFCEAIEDASLRAVKATANDVIKLTLPNGLDNVNKDKPASKQKGVFKANVKRLEARIRENIMGKGIEGEDGMATAVPSADGNPLKKTIKGKSYYGIFLLAKPKGSKRRIKATGQKVKYANSYQEVINFIKKNSKLIRKKVAYRQRTGSEVIWIKKPSLLKQAATQMGKRAGNLLSGWAALTQKVENDTLSILSAQNVDKAGSAKISVKNGQVQFKASNDESHPAISSYQQRMVDSNIPKTLKYHLENNINRINWKNIRKSSIK